MNKSNVIELNNRAKTIDDPITELIRNGAKKILKEALEAENEPQSFFLYYSTASSIIYSFSQVLSLVQAKI